MNECLEKEEWIKRVKTKERFRMLKMKKILQW